MKPICYYVADREGLPATLTSPREDNVSNVAKALCISLGLFGAALLYGDGTITPAISVLSAIEGLEVVTPFAKPYVVPITLAILLGLFAIQHKGTQAIGNVFGPVMVLWFLALGALGINGILQNPEVLRAVNPMWAIEFLFTEKGTAILVMGAVFLCVTGGETLYADMGHFGRGPIVKAWFILVFPALVLNYMGQGALVLSDAAEIQHPFYHLAPHWALIPLVILSTLATVIASQAVISGVFSLTRQAILLKRLPHLRIEQTSDRAYGQIYIPVVNWMLMFATMALVVGFGSSEALASAYGLAISLDMMITTLLILVVFIMRGANPVAVAAMGVMFLTMDLLFFGANVVKIFQGGWYPILVGLTIFALMKNWEWGRKKIREKYKAENRTVGAVLQQLRSDDIKRTQGVGIFVSEGGEGAAPSPLIRCIDQIKAVPEVIIIVRTHILEKPYIPVDDQIEIRRLSKSAHEFDIQIGYMDKINLPKIIERSVAKAKLDIKVDRCIYFVERNPNITAPETFNISANVFRWLNRNNYRATDFFKIPPNRVIELGARRNFDKHVMAVN